MRRSPGDRAIRIHASEGVSRYKEDRKLAVEEGSQTINESYLGRQSNRSLREGIEFLRLREGVYRMEYGLLIRETKARE
jgi:hypothetical protein